ncbi:MAG: RluA family pseudouridine synthase [Clostridiales bacterium]|nr:RluA family pseudouridine synthase [Clostridiales bacterium]
MREDIKILYEDNHLLVVVKPQNIPAQSDESGDKDLLTILKEYLVEKYNKPGEAYLALVHRLDRPTGGVMVFAKTSKAAARLSEAIRSGDVEKRYLAVVHGAPREKQKKLVCYLKKFSDNFVRIVPPLTEGAKYAELDYVTLKTEKDFSLVKVNLVTGRGHQIRVQMSGIGNPIAGDMRYGGEDKIKVPLCLWAYEMKFNHPISGARLVFRVYPPEDQPLWNLFDIEHFLRLSIKNDTLYTN